jgi:hypothetical protein
MRIPQLCSRYEKFTVGQPATLLVFEVMVRTTTTLYDLVAFAEQQ